MKPEYEDFQFEYELERGDESFDLQVFANVDEYEDVAIQAIKLNGNEFEVTPAERKEIQEYAEDVCEGYDHYYREEVAYCLDDEGD